MKNKILAVILIIVFTMTGTMSSFASTLSVTAKGKTYSYDSEGNAPGPNIHGYYVANDKSYGAVYCGEHDKVSPVEFGSTKDFSPKLYDNNQQIRKILYYGYRGVKEWSGFGLEKYNHVYTTGGDSCAESPEMGCGNAVTAMALTEAYNKTGDGHGTWWNVSGLKEFKAFIKEMPAPGDNFVVYRLPGGSGKQDLFTWKYSPCGSFKLKKVTSEKDKIANGGYNMVGRFRNSYSLKDAKYGIYPSKAAAEENKNRITTLTTDKNGLTETVTLDEGTYYLKEVRAPSGYRIDEMLYRISIRDGESVTKEVGDVPQRAAIKIKKEKASASDYPIKGAEYSIYGSKEDAEKKRNSLKVLKTNEKGETESWRCPPGSYYARETKAPAGYVMDKKIYKCTLKDKDFYTFSVKDQPEEGKVMLKKKASSKNILLEICPEHYSLKGAEYTVYSAENDKPAGKLITDSNGETKSITVPAGKYYAVETKPPKGFELNSTPTETITVKHGNTGTFHHSDKPVADPLSFEIIKEGDRKDGFTLEGAEYKVEYYKDFLNKDEAEKSEPFRTWVVKTKENKNKTMAMLRDEYLVEEKSDPLIKDEKGNVIGPPGTYVFYETAAPYGYTKTEGILSIQHSELKYDDKKQEVKTSFVKSVKHKEESQSIKLTIDKKDAETGKNEPQGHGSLKGAVYRVYHKDSITGAEVEDGVIVTDEQGRGSIEGLLPGKYYIREIKAPDGYLLDETVYEKDCMAQNSEFRVFEYTLNTKDTPGETVISKQSEGKMIQNALLQLKNRNGDVLEEFTTTKENYVIKGLPPGEYILHEVKAPEGYVKAEDILFEVKYNEARTSVIMEDGHTKILIEKKDENGNLLPGAKLSLVKNTGEKNIDEEEVLKTWVTGKKPESIEYIPAGNYYIVEEKAPEGYIQKKPVPITIEDKEEVQHFEVINNRVSVLKTDKNTMKPLEGGQFIVRNQKGKTIDRWTSDKEKHFIRGLSEGETYELEEIKAPEGYVRSAVKTFTAGEKEKDSNFIIVNKPITAEFLKVDKNTGKPIEGAVLQLVDTDGNIVVKWVSEKEPLKLEGLSEGEYVIREIRAPEGYKKSEDRKIIVKEISELQKFVIDNSKITPVLTEKNPETGEPSHIFFFIGSLICVAGMLISLKKRQR